MSFFVPVTSRKRYMWEYEDSNESNWSNHARECYPIAVSIPELIYLGFSRNIKNSLETSRFLSKPTTSTLCFSLGGYKRL